MCHSKGVTDYCLVEKYRKKTVNFQKTPQTGLRVKNSKKGVITQYSQEMYKTCVNEIVTVR